MPGIFGVIEKKHLNKNSCETALNTMAEQLCHHKWYRKEQYQHNHIGFGSVSINSPFPLKKLSHRGKEYIVVIDGYIYSISNKSTPLSKSSSENVPEMVLSYFISRGSDGLTGIEGNYIVAIYNLSDDELTVFNDIVGPRRLYYADLPERLIWAPEVKALCFQPFFNKDLDLKGIADFFNYGYPLGENTFFSTVKCFPPASILSYKKHSDAFTLQRYWKPAYTERNIDLNDAADEAVSLLEHSIDEKTGTGNTIISPISGGLDSRIILAILKGAGKDLSLKPITYGQHFSHEFKNARKVCRQLDIDNHSLIEIHPEALIDKYARAVWLSEGMIPMTNAHLLLLPPIIGTGYDYLFNGIYGGPTNYSAEYYRDDHIDGAFSFNEKANDIYKVLSLNPSYYQGILSSEMSQSIEVQGLQSIGDSLQDFLDVSDRFCDQRDAFFIENRMRRCICQSSLYRFFWEEQLPLSNYSLYAFYRSTPPELKLKKTLIKTMLKRKFPELAKIENANTGLNLFQEPSYFFTKRKTIERYLKYYLPRLSGGRIILHDRTAYVHYSSWYRRDKETSRFHRDSLFSPGLQASGLFNLNALEKLLLSVKQSGMGYQHLLRLTTFAIWYDLFVIGNGTNQFKE